MNSQRKVKLELFQRIVFLFYCFFVGATLISFSIIGYTAERVSLGILFLLASIFHIVELQKNYKKLPARYIYFGLTVVGIVLGIVSIVVDSIELTTVCLIFGIMDTTSGLLEIFTNSVILKKTIKTSINFVEYAISAADILFGIILMIELEEGLLVHVIYLGTVFLTNGIIVLVELIGHWIKHE